MEIDEIIAKAKAYLMEDGTHRPMLFFETDKPQLVIAEIGNMLETPDERMKQFFSIGRKMGQELLGQQLRESALIVMAWASIQRPGEPPPQVPPSQDPQRIEIAIIEWLRILDERVERAEHIERRTEVYQILRGGDKKSVDLFHLPDSPKNPPNPLLVYFMGGFKSALYSDEALIAMVDGTAQGSTTPPAPPVKQSPRKGQTPGTRSRGKPDPHKRRPQHKPNR